MIGSGLITNQRREPAGAPFPATAADNGLSVDSTTGRIVLGNGGGDGSKPAQFLNNREIVTNNNEFALRDVEGPFTTLRAILNPGFIQSDDFTAFKKVLLQPGLLTIADKQNVAGKPSLFFDVNNALGDCTVRNNNGVMEFLNVGGSVCLSVDMTTGRVTLGDLGAAGGGWKLGKKTAGAVALDGANFVSVNIDGVAVKLAIVV